MDKVVNDLIQSIATASAMFYTYIKADQLEHVPLGNVKRLARALRQAANQLEYYIEKEEEN